MKRMVTTILATVGLVLGAGSAALADSFPKNAVTKCSPDAVVSGTACMDTYEASVWQTTNASLIRRIKRGTATLSELTGAGAIQLGLAAGDLAAAGCPATGNECTNVFAVSIPEVTPSAFLTQFQAAAAARNSGKRLPSNAEWQAAALGTPDPGTDDEATDCNITGPPFAVAPTGSRSSCVSDVGAFDMVGNLSEWVADWVPLSTTCVSALFAGTNDVNCLAGASTNSGPGALIRGGDFDFVDGSNAGVFAVGALLAPSGAGSGIGFRAAR